MRKTIEHPLESVFGMESGTMDFEFDNQISTPIETQITPINPIEKDDEDQEIDENIKKIFNAAMDAYESQTAFTEIVEPKFAARNAEVAAQYLSLALNATALKAKTKNDKRKNQQFAPINNSTTNNVVIMDRNKLLDMFSDENSINL